MLLGLALLIPCGCSRAPAPSTPSAVATAVATSSDSRTSEAPSPAGTQAASPTQQAASGANVMPTPTREPTSTASPAPSLLPTDTPRPTPTATGAPPAIRYFKAEPATINPGDPVKLLWDASGGLIQIVPLDELGRLTSPGYVVPLTGTLVITPSKTARNKAAFVLFAGDPATGDYVQANATVGVRCPDAWFFTPAPQSCPWPAKTGRAVIQPFERGLMLWTEPENQVYSLFSDGSIPAWDSWTDTFKEGQPESDPALVPPEGLLQPIRGFGKVWREQSSGGVPVRDRLGWATGPEREISGALQCDSSPRYATCYLRGGDNSVYELGPERSSWAVLPTPAP